MAPSGPVLVADGAKSAPLRSKQQTPMAGGATSRSAARGERRQPGPEASGSEAGSNAEFIAEHILRKCSSMPEASKFFQWLKSGERTVRGRALSREDVREAERLCGNVWGTPDLGRAQASSAPAQPAPSQPAPSQPAPPTRGLSRARTVSFTDHISGLEREGSSKEISNVDVILQHVLRECPSSGKAEAFFKQMRAVGASSALGHIFAEEELVQAQRRAAEALRARGGKDLPAEAAGTRVGVIVQYILQRFNSMRAAARFFYMLHRTAGETNQLGLLFSQENVVEARCQCAATFEERQAAAALEAPPPTRTSPSASSPAPRRRSTAGSPAAGELDNVDFIVKHVLREFDNKNKAEEFLDGLHGSVGRTSVLGRVFSAEEITEAWLRCTVCYDEQERESLAAAASQQGEGAAAGGLAEEADDDASSSDDDELSGEEAVDEEEAGPGLSHEELMADLGVEAEPENLTEDGYPSHVWEEGAKDVLPGFPGFNARAAVAMRAAEVAQASPPTAEQDETACPPLQPHQETVAFLLHPRSPVLRLLVDHPTGSGKTREMIRVLDNYFYDPRPKVPIFPKDSVCRNFYAELLRWPNRYRDYYACERPEEAALASGAQDWKTRRRHMWDLGRLSSGQARRLCLAIREVLEMKGMAYMGLMRRSFRVAFRRKCPGEPMPLAPLRAISYTSAGGAFSAIAPGGLPVSALMKIGYERGCGNVYTNKVVLLDEAHNLVRTQTQYGTQLERLRSLLDGTQNCVLAGFTGTPILSDPSEGRRLLQVVKGHGAPDGDEGFLSSFPARPRHLFPAALPSGVPDGLLTAHRRQQLTRRVELRGEALRVYDVKRQNGMVGHRLRAYCNVSCFYASFHDGKGGSKARILASPEECCPKLYAVAQDVAASPEKALVLVGRTSGYAVLLELLRLQAARSNPPFRVATMEEASEFNHVSNLRGTEYRVLVADASQCSEGVSFIGVRRSLLVDVPTSHSQLVQQCGRAIRMYSHRGLPEEEQVVTTRVYTSVLPKWLRSPLACLALRAQKHTASGADMEKRARLLLARFRRAGIGGLEELKETVDAHCSSAEDLTSDGARPVPSVECVADLLEQNGLWEDARMVRGKRDRERSRRAIGTEQAPAQRPRGLVQAVRELFLAASAEEAIRSLAIQPETADEEALRQLAAQAEEIVPALAAMHRSAVDREILGAFAASAAAAAPAAPGAEDAACEVDVVEAGSEPASEPEELEEEEDGGAAEGPAANSQSGGLKLPRGWRFELVRRTKRRVREVVDPNGKRYRSLKEARPAVAAWERSGAGAGDGGEAVLRLPRAAATASAARAPPPPPPPGAPAAAAPPAAEAPPPQVEPAAVAAAPAEQPPATEPAPVAVAGIAEQAPGAVAACGQGGSGGQQFAAEAPVAIAPSEPGANVAAVADASGVALVGGPSGEGAAGDAEAVVAAPPKRRRLIGKVAPSQVAAAAAEPVPSAVQLPAQAPPEAAATAQPTLMPPPAGVGALPAAAGVGDAKVLVGAGRRVRLRGKSGPSLATEPVANAAILRACGC